MSNILEQIPLQILTGFLGSGKTTLLNKGVQNPDMKGTVLIINEVGEIGIDNKLISTDNPVILLDSGCICCSIQDGLVNVLHYLIEEIDNNNLEVNRVIIETTGIADPAPIIDFSSKEFYGGKIKIMSPNINTGEIIIQDIKTWSVPTQSSELKAPLQFAVYTMAAEQLWGVPLEKIKCEYDLPLCDITQAALSDNIVADGKPILDKLFKGIHDKNFKPTITALCHWCEYNPLTNPAILDTKPEAVCPYFSTWQKSGDSVRDTLISWQGLDSIAIDRQFIVSQLKQHRLAIN